MGHAFPRIILDKGEVLSLAKTGRCISDGPRALSLATASNLGSEYMVRARISHGGLERASYKQSKGVKHREK